MWFIPSDLTNSGGMFAFDSGKKITESGLKNSSARLFPAYSVMMSVASEIIDIFRANIVDVTGDSLMIEITGDEEKIESMLKLLKGFGIREIARTGRIAMVSGNVGAAGGKSQAKT